MLMIFFLKNLWLGWQDLNLRITGSKPVALPLGYTPLKTQSNKQVILKLLDYCVKLVRIFIQMISRVLIENVA